MQSLLRWSIENSTPQDSAPSDHPPAERKDLDPGIIDMILGRPDAELMKEDVAAATDASRSEDERVDALDHLEMLIEQIDNANNLENLKLWTPLHSLLTSDASTLSIKMQTLWVLGTAMQNNPSAQDAYLSLDPLSTLVSFLTPSPSSTLQTRSKAIYTLSGLLKHNVPAIKKLSDPSVDGWARLRSSLQDPEITVRRKTVFLLGTLLLPTTPSAPSTSQPGLHVPSTPSPDQPAQPVFDNSHAAYIHDPSRASTSQLTHEALQTYGIIGAVISALTDPLPFGEDGDSSGADPAFEEQGIRLLHTYVVLCRGQLSQTDKEVLRSWFEIEKANGGEKELADKWNLDLPELKELFLHVV